MGNTESGLVKVCGSKHPRPTKKATIETNGEVQSPDIDDSNDMMDDFDEGGWVEKNRDNYFNRDDADYIIKKFPNYKDWLESMVASTNSKARTKHKRVKWKEGEVIGNGSFGKVVMGLDLQTGSIMAVKQVQIGLSNTAAQQERLKALEIEIEMLSQLSHKNIVRYRGCQKTRTAFNIFLEYISGGTIASLIDKYGPLNENLIRVYTKQILEGLEYLHVRNTMHRDIKGANVLVDNTGVCKLTDFGTAKRISSIVETELKYMPSIRGTPFWMAPEVIKQSSVGRFSDIWSLGCTVLEMATGKAPWSNMMNSNGNAVAALYQIAKAKSHPPLPENLSPEITDFLKQCFTINTAERPNVIKLLNHRFILGVDQIEKPIHPSDVEKVKVKKLSAPPASKHKKSDASIQKINDRPESSRPKSVNSKRKNSKQDSYNQLDDSIRPTSVVFAEKGQKESPEGRDVGEIKLIIDKPSQQEQAQVASAQAEMRSPKRQETKMQKLSQPPKINKLVLPETVHQQFSPNKDYTCQTIDLDGEVNNLKSERNASNPAPLKLELDHLQLPEGSERAVKTQEKVQKRFNFGYIQQNLASEMSPCVDESFRVKTFNASDVQGPIEVVKHTSAHRNSDSGLKTDSIPIAKLKRRTRPLGKNDHQGSFRHLGQSQIGEEEYSSMNVSTLNDILQKSHDGNVLEPLPQRHIRNRSLFSIKDLNSGVAEREAEEERKVEEQVQKDEGVMETKQSGVQELGFKTPESKQKDQRAASREAYMTPMKSKAHSRKHSGSMKLLNISDVMNTSGIVIAKNNEPEAADVQKVQTDGFIKNLTEVIDEMKIELEVENEADKDKGMDLKADILDDVQLAESVLLTKRDGKDVDEKNIGEKTTTERDRRFDMQELDFVKKNPFTQKMFRPKTLGEKASRYDDEEEVGSRSPDKRSLTVPAVVNFTRENHIRLQKHADIGLEALEEKEDSDENVGADGSTYPSNKRDEGVAQERADKWLRKAVTEI